MRRSSGVPRTVIVGLLLVLTGCQAGGSSPSASGVSSVTPSATPGPTARPTPALPLVIPPPTDLPTDGTCEEGHSCLGLLEAGKAYTTIAFTPALTFTMPEDRWENISDEGGTFILFSLGHPGDTIAFFRNPVARGAGSAQVGTSVDELATWLATNPLVDVTPFTPVTIGGLHGVTMDFTIADGAQSNGTGCPVQVCVDLFRATDPRPHPSWEWEWGSAGPESQRLYLLTASDGVVAIFIDSLDGTTFDTLSALGDTLLASATFN